MIESPINYMGSKYIILDELIPLFPKLPFFLDLFTGGGSVYMNVNHLYEKVIANDIITDLIEIHKNMQKKEFIAEASIYSVKTKNSQEEYLKLRESYNTTHSPQMLLALIWSCNSNMMRFNNDFKFNQTWGKRAYNKNTDKKWVEYSKKDYSNVKFLNLDFYELGKRVDERCFVYIDPPYHQSAAGYNAFWSNKNEDDLLKLLAYYIEKNMAFGISGVLNGKPNRVYEFLENKGLYTHWFGDLYKKISKKEKVNHEYYITNRGI